jgi:hypothetical protein
MKDYPIPIMAYAFIGITSLVLAYATFLDKEGVKGSPGSATSMLPSVKSLNPFSATATPENKTIGSMPIAQAVPIASAPNPVALDKKTTVGGKTKRNKKGHRSTKRHKK